MLFEPELRVTFDVALWHLMRQSATWCAEDVSKYWLCDICSGIVRFDLTRFTFDLENLYKHGDETIMSDFLLF